jgi:hypothetical protein
MDSIRSSINRRNENRQLYIDKIVKEETQKWNNRYEEISNLQKATYSAAKKNSALLESQLDMIGNELHKLIELKRLSMEGQKNALNMEIQHNRANTKQLINVLQEESKKQDYAEQLSKILDRMEINNQLIKEYSDHLKCSDYSQAGNVDIETASEQDNEYVSESEAEESTNTVKVNPLYDDPNKNLSTDEIAALFASVGK